MLTLTDKEIATIDMRLEKSIRSLVSAKERWAEARQTSVAISIDTTDQIALVEALCQSLPDPSRFNDKLVVLKKCLEEFEDMIHNPQDKAEILAAIAKRPNTADKQAQ